MNYSTMTVQELWQTYNAIMAGAWPGNENDILDELAKRGVF